jgi:hypothetical protein
MSFGAFSFFSLSLWLLWLMCYNISLFENKKSHFCRISYGVSLDNRQLMVTATGTSNCVKMFPRSFPVGVNRWWSVLVTFYVNLHSLTIKIQN